MNLDASQEPNPFAVRIDYLANHPDCVPQIAEWFYREWAPLYKDVGLHEIALRIGSRLNYDKIPLTIIALRGRELIGTAGLKESDMDTHPEISPWLAGLYVAEKERCKGIGKMLVDKIVTIAGELKISRLFLFTPCQEPFYKKMGWELLTRESYHEHLVSIMSKAL
jgi:N-acetylglutamate synthase-like GNAT family acetyltransferase